MGPACLQGLGLEHQCFRDLRVSAAWGGTWRQVLSLGFCMESRERDELEPAEFLFRPWKIAETLKIWAPLLLSPLSEVEPG